MWFYLVFFGNYKPIDIVNQIKHLCLFIINFKGRVPGATPKECGNYSDQDLSSAKLVMRKYLAELKANNRIKYPN